MIVRCPCCAKQVVSYHVSRHDKECTIRKGGRAGFTSSEVFCGYCAEDLDENGLFPEERALAEISE